jgi:hypothetical protein
MIGHLARLPNWIVPAQQSKSKAPYPTASISKPNLVVPEPQKLICTFFFLKIMIRAIVPRWTSPLRENAMVDQPRPRLRREGPYFEAEVCFAQKPIVGGEFQIEFSYIGW